MIRNPDLIAILGGATLALLIGFVFVALQFLSFGW